MKVIFKTQGRFSFLRTFLLILLAIALGYLRFFVPNPMAKSTAVTASIVSIPTIHTEPPPPKVEPSLTITNLKVARNQTFSELMQTIGFTPQTVQDVLDGARSVYNLNQIHEGKTVKVTASAGNLFDRLEYNIDPTQTLVVTRKNDSISAEILHYKPDTKVQELGGLIEGSLYATIDRLGGDDQLVVDFADIFEWDVDFFKDLQPEDQFKIVYERNFINGQPYGNGRILAAQLVNKGHTYTAYGFQSDKNWMYYSEDGKAMRRAFLAAPLKFSRISSGFTSHRYHPILHTYRAHYGIDYVAPTGTPVRAIGNGTVLSAGWAGGAGKMISIRHNKEISTFYCHLSRFAAGIKKGASVTQGEVIGYVGMTGLATGPHLDFRFMKNGKLVNFLSVKGMQDQEPLSASELKQFHSVIEPLIAELENVELKKPAHDIAYVPSTPVQISQ